MATGRISSIRADKGFGFIKDSPGPKGNNDVFFHRSAVADGTFDDLTEGQEVSFKLVGNLTIREITKPVTFDVTGKLVGDTVTGTAVTQILMKDFGFDPPSIAGMLTVKDGVTIRVNFTAKEAK